MMVEKTNDGNQDKGVSGQIPPPPRLAQLQAAFGESIRVPFSFSTGRFQCQKDAFAELAADAILSRGSLSGRDRLAIYNEQYWYRLLTVLQEDFPLLARTLGLWTFNQLASDFLESRPSRSPYLQNLADGFLDFMRGRYLHDNLRLVQIAELEIAFLQAFHAPSGMPLIPGNLSETAQEALGDSPLAFQAWFFLCEEDWNLMETRAGMVADETAKPVFSEQKGYWMVYRNFLRDEAVEWRAVNPLAFRLLKRIQAGKPLGEACEIIASELTAEESGLLLEGLPLWFSEWTRMGFFLDPSQALKNG